MNESIRTFWRFGYFKLFDESGLPNPEITVSTEGHDWRKVFWRFYWREA